MPLDTMFSVVATFKGMWAWGSCCLCKLSVVDKGARVIGNPLQG